MKESNDHTMDHIDQQWKEMEERWGNVFKTVYHINWRTGLPMDSFVNNMEIKYESIRLNNKTARKGFFTTDTKGVSVRFGFVNTSRWTRSDCL